LKKVFTSPKSSPKERTLTSPILKAPLHWRGVGVRLEKFISVKVLFLKI